MKTFKDEFTVFINNEMFQVSAQGHTYKEDGHIYYEVDEFIIFDEDDQIVESDHYDYDELLEEIHGRDYNHVAETDDDFSDMY